MIWVGKAMREKYLFLSILELDSRDTELVEVLNLRQKNNMHKL